MNNCLNFVRCALPQDCMLCGARSSHALLCHACQSDLPRIPGACPSCALPSGGAICGECLRHPPAFDRTFAALAYGFPVDKLVQQLKYSGQLALAHWLGETLWESVRAAPRPDLILPMPLHPARLTSRGFNQALEIARPIARHGGVPLVPDLARRTLDTAPQASQALDARHKNIKGAFACDADLSGRHIALIDDVMTSGATLNELARTLKRAGAAQISVWVVARALPHH
jgi:ComF family protein